jgi:integrase
VVQVPRRTEPIRKIILKNGQVRYRFVIRVGKKPNGKPDQRTFTYDTLKEAREERAKIIADKARGTLVRATKVTVNEQCDEYLAGRRTLRPSTLSNYTHALKPVRERLGHVLLQQLTKAHVDQLVNDMLANGRRVGTKGRPLSPRAVTLTLTVLAMVLDDAVKQGHLVRNVARLVDRPAATAREMSTWTAKEASAFLTYVAEDRLYVAWLMSLYGLRRGEVLGLRWCDIDLTGRLARERGLPEGTPSLVLRTTRVIVDGEVIHSEPKTAKGKRTLPLDAPMVAALTALQLRQRDEADEAESAYTAACPDCGEAHVVVDELGEPVHPESYSDRFEVLNRKAKLPAIRLHDTRHTCGTLMHLRGVPPVVIAAWLGHADASFTIKTYCHSQDEAMTAAGATLAAAYETVSDVDVRKRETNHS